MKGSEKLRYVSVIDKEQAYKGSGLVKAGVVLTDYLRTDVIKRFYKGDKSNCSTDSYGGDPVIQLEYDKPLGKDFMVWRDVTGNQYPARKINNASCEFRYNTELIDEVTLGIKDKDGDKKDYLLLGVRPNHGDFIVRHGDNKHTGGNYKPETSFQKMELSMRWDDKGKLDVKVGVEKQSGEHSIYKVTKLDFMPKDGKLAFGMKSSGESDSQKAIFKDVIGLGFIEPNKKELISSFESGDLNTWEIDKNMVGQ